MDLVSQAKKAKADTERCLEEAFGFLEREYNYESCPIEWGRGPYHQFTKRYQLGGRRISFFMDYDHKGVFGMSISPVDLSARQELRPSIRYVEPGMLLEVALQRRGHAPQWKEHESFSSALQYYADLLQREFRNEIVGDFSAYPNIEYSVELEQLGASKAKRTLIGKFANLQAAENSALQTINESALGPNDSVVLRAQYAG